MNFEPYTTSVLVLTLLSVAAAIALPEDEAEVPEMQNFTEYAEEIMTDWGVPGMAVSVIKDGEVIFTQCLGLRDVEKNLPVTTRTLFAIGSCSKAFTSTAAGILVDEGRLEWDAPVIGSFPEFRMYDEYVTMHVSLRDLLSHRTGLPGCYELLWFALPLERKDYFNSLAYLKPNKGFREEFQYSNLIYTVTGVLIGRSAGCTWEEFVKNRIFEPLSMESSNFSVSETLETDDFAQPYQSKDGETVKIAFRNIDSFAPAGGIISNIDDMGRWLLLQLNEGKFGGKQIISSQSLSQLHNPQMAIANKELAAWMQASLYGMGWFVSDFRGHRLVEHGGNIDGFSALCSFLPEEGIGVVVLTNSMNVMTYVIARNIFDRLLRYEKRDWNSRYKDLYERIKALSPLISRGSKSGRKTGTKPSLPLANYAGIYEHPAFGRLGISYENGRLSAIYAGKQLEVDHYHYDVFCLKVPTMPDIKVRFALDYNGNVEGLAMLLSPGVDEIVFKPIRNDAKQSRRAKTEMQE